MARLHQTSWGLNSLTVGMEINTTPSSGTTSITTSNTRGGSSGFAWRSNPTASTGYCTENLFGANQNTSGYQRAYIRIATVPSGGSSGIMRFVNAAITVNTSQIVLTTSGTLRLLNSTGVQVGSDSAALSTGVWYCIELRNNASAGTGTVDGRIDGVSFASGNNDIRGSWANGGLGAITSTTTDINYSDWAINDSSGAHQTSWPGTGTIIYLRPSANGDASAWTTSTGSGNHFTFVDEVPPNDATDYVKTGTVNAVDLYNLTDSSLGASPISVVAVGVRYANLSGTSVTSAFKAEIEKTGSGTKTQSAAIVPNSLTWVSDIALITYTDPDGAAWTGTTLDSAQAGVICTAFLNWNVAISALWVTVDYIGSTDAPAESAAITVTANNATVSVRATAQSVSVTALSDIAGTGSSATAASASITATANNATASTSPTGGVATQTATANNAHTTITTAAQNVSVTALSDIAGTGTSATTTPIAITGSANTASKTVSVNQGAVSGTATSYDATTKTAPKVQSAGITAVANQATAVTGTIAYAQSAAIAECTYHSGENISFAAGSSAVTATANNAVVMNLKLVPAGIALARSSAPDITTPIGSKSSTAFIISMMRPLVQATTFSTITPTTSYSDAYIGAVSGVFVKNGSPRLTEQLCPITVVDPPGVLSDAFRGTVTGVVSGLSGSILYKVQAYKRTDIDYDMGVFGNVDASGDFSIDLSSIAGSQAGEWRFATVLRTTGLGQVGLMYPQPVSFVGLAVESRIITDTGYLTLSQPASADSTFAFTYAAVGRKQFRLVDTVTSAILADYTPETGCVRSYVVEADQPGYGTMLAEQCYVQDQGVALSTMLAIGDLDNAELMADGLLLMQTSGGAYDGGFIYSARHMSPAYGTATYRTGAHATALYALLRFIAIAPHGGRAVYVLAAQRALDYLNLRVSAVGDLTGLYLGGAGVFSSEISYSKRVNQSYDVTWADTESNLAVWWALHHADLVFGGEPYRSRAASLSDKIMSLLWNPSLGRFNRGYTDTSGPDTYDTLAAHTLGAIWLQANNYEALAAATIAQIGPFYRTTSNDHQGYAPVIAY